MGKVKLAVGMFVPGKPPKGDESATVSTTKSQGFILPPAPGKCQECAVEHEPSAPHNRDTLYYQMAFRQKHGRWPTWADAIAHCSEEAKVVLKQLLEEKGVWSEPEEGLSEEEKTARTIGGMPTHSVKPDGGAIFGQVITVDMGGSRGKKRAHHEPRPKDGRGQPGKARGRGRRSP